MGYNKYLYVLKNKAYSPEELSDLIAECELGLKEQILKKEYFNIHFFDYN